MSNSYLFKMFNSESYRTVEEAEKKGLIENQENSVVGVDIKTKDEFNGRTFVRKIKLVFGRINLNVW